MDLASFHRTKLRGWARRLRQSERLEWWCFYGHYFRWPVLLILLALAGEKFTYYGLLPLRSLAMREWACAEAAHDDAIGNETGAARAIRRALLETRSNARVWRLAARISEHSHSPEATYCWQKADRLEPGLPETEFSLAESALQNGEADLAQGALAEMAVNVRTATRYRIDAGRCAQMAENEEGARAWFDSVEASQPEDSPTLFALADWHAAQADEKNLDRARAILSDLARRTTERPAALRALIDLDLKRHDLSQAEMESEALLAQPAATFTDRIRRLDIADRLGDPQLQDRLNVLLQDGEADNRAAVIDWMAAHGRARAALDWLRGHGGDLPRAPALAKARANCLAVLGAWAELRDEQRAAVWPGHEPERLAILVRADLALKQPGDAREAWNEAVAACREGSDYLGLLRDAEKFDAPDGWAEEKAQVWAALARQYPDQQWPLRALLAYELGRDDLLQVEAIYGRLAALDADDPAPAANRDLIGLLRGEESSRATADLQRLESSTPDNPIVATAAAYALYLQGRFDEALHAMGALTPDELAAPERAAYLGQFLAVAGPVDRAESCLRAARARSQLLPEERAGVDHALDLVAYRRAMAGLRPSASSEAREQSQTFLAWQAASAKPLFVMGESVALAWNGDLAGAARTLARVEPRALDPAELTIYEGAAMRLTGVSSAATRRLELAGDLAFEPALAKVHGALDAWWRWRAQPANSASTSDGLYATYRALDAIENNPFFWRDDAGRELELTRRSLLRGDSDAAVQNRLESLLRRVPGTAEMEAQIGYALALQGRVATARARLEILSPADLEEPEIAFYYGTILRACGENGRAAEYLRRAATFSPTPTSVAQSRENP
jgi:Flp pilus assembly protein TadD